jgi:hypothetical protein
VTVVTGVSQGEVDTRIGLEEFVKGGKIVVWEVGEGTWGRDDLVVNG